MNIAVSEIQESRETAIVIQQHVELAALSVWRQAAPGKARTQSFIGVASGRYNFHLSENSCTGNCLAGMVQLPPQVLKLPQIPRKLFA